jgi:hypothetical protein
MTLCQDGEGNSASNEGAEGLVGAGGAEELSGRGCGGSRGRRSRCGLAGNGRRGSGRRGRVSLDRGSWGRSDLAAGRDGNRSGIGGDDGHRSRGSWVCLRRRRGRAGRHNRHGSRGSRVCLRGRRRLRRGQDYSAVNRDGLCAVECRGGDRGRRGSLRLSRARSGGVVVASGRLGRRVRVVVAALRRHRDVDCRSGGAWSCSWLRRRSRDVASRVDRVAGWLGDRVVHRLAGQARKSSSLPRFFKGRTERTRRRRNRGGSSWRRSRRESAGRR